ncbi:(2Fe-2S)-binding protein [Bradyrhizobium cosmicum]|uniref:(2Fe-2S)-binding protein n=1 Tax=Bradyrhizobium cosmicum TaxID=1404864 RepID=UPI001164398E|nr:(2Fe-2S)-binding protein [Bradyrhizobium cosmicum]QDP25293.1 (2Fe-2S)-binding protein [Bradyrhizobium cosmicum]
MIVCSCNVISDHDIRSVVVSADDGLCSAAQVYGCLGCTVRCGHCSHSVRRILAERSLDCAQYPGDAEIAPRP